MTASLNELADRVEAESGPDRELFEDIWRTVFPQPERIWITDNTGDWTPEYAAWIERQHLFYGFLDAEAYLDAAMTLVPEGHAFSLHVDADGSVFAGCMPDDGDGCDDARRCGATPALALTAAALRSLASRGGGDG